MHEDAAPRSLPRRTRPGATRRAFSMAELMIAIVILGIGLLMAAVMFPVAWTRARELAEFTNQSTATNAAQTTVKLLTGVARPNPSGPAPFTTTSFLGDIDPDNAVVADGAVHVLHVENLLADVSLRVSNSSETWGEALRSDSMDPPTGVGEIVGIDPAAIDMDWWMGAGTTGIPAPQVALHERVFPPLPAPPPPNDPTIDRWRSLFESRRFSWTVLHKIDGTPAANQPRNMTFFFVTTRRAQSAQRFARQNPTPPGPFNTEPEALPATEDMLLPVPWLVNLQVKGNWDPGNGTPLDPKGVPSEADALPGAGGNGRLIAQMLQPGSVLIDRLTGNVYTVKQHRFTGTGDNFDKRATVTLDREILGADVDDGGIVGTVDIGTEDLRDFWVFPPAVDRGAGGEDGFPIFDGGQPVVGVEVRQMVFTP